MYKDGVVRVAADHVRQNERISDDSVEEHGRYERAEAVVATPVRVLVHQAREDGHVLRGDACANFLQPQVRVTPATRPQPRSAYIILTAAAFNIVSLVVCIDILYYMLYVDH